MLANKMDAAFLHVATETKTSATLVTVSAATCKKAASVLLANIATSIPYRQYCFAHDSSCCFFACEPKRQRQAQESTLISYW